MTPASIPLATIARFSHSGMVYRSFGHFLAAQNGSLLAVPVVMAAGDFRNVVDGCPVPFVEVLAVIETPVMPFAEVLHPGGLEALAPMVAALFPPYGWVQDVIPAGDGWGAVGRVVSPDGVRFCWVFSG